MHLVQCLVYCATTPRGLDSRLLDFLPVLFRSRNFGDNGSQFLLAGCPSCHRANSVKALNCRPLPPERSAETASESKLSSRRGGALKVLQCVGRDCSVGQIQGAAGVWSDVRPALV